MSKLDPRTKMVVIVAITTLAMVIREYTWLAGLLVVTVLAMTLGGIKIQDQWNQAKGFLAIILFIFILQALFGQPYLGLVLALRLLIIVVSAIILLTGKSADYLLALVQMKMPYQLAYMVVLAFHFFPLIREEALDTYYSLQLRGTDFKNLSIRAKGEAYKSMAMPILAGAIERSKETAIAMEARGFSTEGKRTYMRRLTLRKIDVTVMFLVVIMATSIIGCNVHFQKNQENKQVALSITGPGKVSVSWSDSEEYQGVLIWNQEEIKAEVTKIGPSHYRYTCQPGNVEEGKTYKYQVGKKNNLTSKFKYTCAKIPKDPDKSWAFMYMGDIQYQIRDRDYPIWGDFLKKSYSENKDIAFGILGGDMVEKGPDVKDWVSFLTNGQPVFSRVPFMTTVGNHETSIRPDTYLQMMAMPTNGTPVEECYSFDYGDVHFVALNSCLFMEESANREGYSEMLEAAGKWLEEDLAGNKSKWTVVYFHHPMYPVVEDDPLYENMRSRWEPILVGNKVDLVLCGHQHVYMRTKAMNGIVHIMANSGEKKSYYLTEGVEIPDYIEEIYQESPTYLRVEVSDKALLVKVFNKEGQLVDSCQIEKI